MAGDWGAGGDELERGVLKRRVGRVMGEEATVVGAIFDNGAGSNVVEVAGIASASGDNVTCDCTELTGVESMTLTAGGLGIAGAVETDGACWE